MSENKEMTVWLFNLGKTKDRLFYLKSEKAMAPLSSTLVSKLPWTEEPGRLQSIGSRTVRHDSATSLSLFSFMHWRRKWQLYFSVLAWRIPGTGEPGGLPSMGSQSQTQLKRLSSSSSDVCTGGFFFFY